MPSPPRRRTTRVNLPINNTVKLPDALRARVERAMAIEGFTVWSEFCRVALTEKCAAVERNLRRNDPEQYQQLYAVEGR